MAAQGGFSALGFAAGLRGDAMLHAMRAKTERFGGGVTVGACARPTFKARTCITSVGVVDPDGVRVVDPDDLGVDNALGDANVDAVGNL